LFGDRAAEGITPIKGMLDADVMNMLVLSEFNFVFDSKLLTVTMGNGLDFTWDSRTETWNLDEE
jgi:hypothetical protein